MVSFWKMNNKIARKVSIYGLGMFGYALLKHFDQKKSESIQLYAYDRKQELVSHLDKEKRHPVFHKSVKLSSYPIFSYSAEELLSGCDILILAVSSSGMEEVAKSLDGRLPANVIIVNTAKALDSKSGARLSEVFKKSTEKSSYDYAAIAGGTIAKDLFSHEPLGVNIACNNPTKLNILEEVFETDNLEVYGTTDLKGVEYAGALKNIVAILAGTVKGLGFSYGSETHMISKVSQRVSDVCINEFGCSSSTFSMGSQCWGNDLWMSCTGSTRNREFGILLGKGIPVDDASNIMSAGNKTIEGLNTLKIINHIEPLKQIKEIGYLYNLVIERNIDINDFKKDLLLNY